MTYLPRFAVAALAVLVALSNPLFFATPSARADSWLPARVTAYVSQNGDWRFTVTPRALRSPLAYFGDKVADHEPAGQAETGANRAQGLLERRTNDGWTTVWSHPLVNDVAPVSALVSDDGAHVVTLDNWHSMGFGDDVVVVYGQQGVVIRAFALTDFLPEDYVGALPRSVSSLNWRGDARIDGRQLVIPVTVPGPDEEVGIRSSTVDIALDLTTGVAGPVDSTAWARAETAAELALAAQRRQEQEWRSYMTDPLLPPTSGDESLWHQYLREAAFRFGEDGATVVLRDPGARDYQASVGFLEARLTARDYRPDKVFIGSPNLANMTAQIERSAASLRANSLADTKFYVVSSADDWPRITAALGPSGASLQRVDPATPIPQLPERLPR